MGEASGEATNTLWNAEKLFILYATPGAGICKL